MSIQIPIQKRHPYTGNLNSETSEDSENAFLHCGDVSGSCEHLVSGQPGITLDFSLN